MPILGVGVVKQKIVIRGYLLMTLMGGSAVANLQLDPQETPALLLGSIHTKRTKR